MKSRNLALDLDREYGRNMRLAGAVSLAVVTAVFLFAPQPRVEPYQLRGTVIDSTWTMLDSTSIIVDPPPPPPDVGNRAVVISNDPGAVTTIKKTTSLNETAHVRPPDPRMLSIPWWKVETKPKELHLAVPEYPELARIAGIEGSVTIAVVVDTLGHVSSTRVLSSSGNVLLDQAAMGAASQCLFRPGYQRDRPVAVEMSIPFKFRLE